MNSFRISGALAALAGLAGVLVLSTGAAHAEPVATSTRPMMRVVGEPSPGLSAGVAYWNGLAGSQVFVYVGAFDGGSEDAQTVSVKVAELPKGLAGLTQGNVGSSPLSVTIAPKAAADWVVWAHELGHTLGLHHDDEPGYAGVMRSFPQGYKVSAADDQQLL